MTTLSTRSDMRVAGALLGRSMCDVAAFAVVAVLFSLLPFLGGCVAFSSDDATSGGDAGTEMQGGSKTPVYEDESGDEYARFASEGQLLKEDSSEDTSSNKALFRTRLDALSRHQSSSGTMSEMAQDASDWYGEYNALLADVLSYAGALSGNSGISALLEEEETWEESREASMVAAGKDAVTGKEIPSGFSASLERLTCGINLTKDRIEALLEAM